MTSKSSKARVRVRSAKQRAYVSPSTLGVIVGAVSTDNAANNASYGFGLTESASNCSYVSSDSGDALACTITFPLAADTYTLTLTTYDRDETGLPASPGTALSIDSESETVAVGANAFSFDPHAYVAGFQIEQEDEGGSIARTRLPSFASRRKSDIARLASATPSPVAAALRYGATGGRSSSLFFSFRALDRDLNFVDEYPGVTEFANGIFMPVVAEPGDTTGCTPSAPCSFIEGNQGDTITYAPSGPTPSPSSSPVTIAQPDQNNEELLVGYNGGGTEGAGIDAWRSANGGPTGTQPYYADFSVPNATNGAFGTVAPYIVPHFFYVPLFGYSTDGLGNKAVTTGPGGGTLYVWAAQAMIPTFAQTNGSSYTATFDSSQTSTCVDSNDDTVMSVTGMTYYAGYGALFDVSVTPDVQTSCALDLRDGFGDETSVALTAPPAIVIESRKR